MLKFRLKRLVELTVRILWKILLEIQELELAQEINYRQIFWKLLNRDNRLILD